MQITPSRSAIPVFQRVPNILLALILAAFAAPLVSLLFYASPVADDFCAASLTYGVVQQRTVAAATWVYYTYFDPRWLSVFLKTLIMSRVDLFSGYSWWLLIVAILDVVALWWFFATAFSFGRVGALLAAGAFYAAWLASIGRPEENLYWLTGSVEYDLSFSTLLLLVTVLIRRRRTIRSYLAIALLSIAIPAQHEFAGTLLLMLLVAGVVLSHRMKLPPRGWYLGLSLAIPSYLTVVLSPGIRSRAGLQHAAVPHGAQLLEPVMRFLLDNGINWLLRPAILGAACCIVLLWPRKSVELPGALRPKYLSIVGLGLIAALLVEAALMRIVTGMDLPFRVSAWFQFVMWLLLVCTILTGVPEIHQVRFSASTRTAAVIVFGVTLLGSLVYREAIADLRGPAQLSRRVLVRRYQRQSGLVELHGAVPYPKLFMHQFVSADSGCWVNQCVAFYMGANAVVARDSPEGCL